jgi:hypothetical protein
VPAILLRFLPHLIALGLVVGAVAYVHQRAYDRGQAEVQAEWDADKALQAQAVENQLKENASLKNETDLLRWKVEQELQPKLAASRDRAADLSKRLRESLALSSRVSEAASTAESGTGDGGRGSQSCGFAPGVERAIEQHFGASARDTAKLIAWQSWWEQLPAELKGE